MRIRDSNRINETILINVHTSLLKITFNYDFLFILKKYYLLETISYYYHFEYLSK